jgi:hypothetical protein
VSVVLKTINVIKKYETLEMIFLKTVLKNYLSKGQVSIKIQLLFLALNVYNAIKFVTSVQRSSAVC